MLSFLNPSAEEEEEEELFYRCYLFLLLNTSVTKSGRLTNP